MPDAPSDHGPAFTCSRRNFWPALIQEFMVVRDSLKGKPGFRLSEMRALPDEQLAQIHPVINSQYEIMLDGDYVCCRLCGKETTRKLFSTQRENLFAFNCFNGQYTLGEIGTYVAQEMAWEEAQGFAHARDLFLALVERLVCMPADPIEF